MNREIAPLVPADDAIVIDTTEISADEVFLKVMTVIENTASLGEISKSHIA
jgi:cytidylate kinase